MSPDGELDFARFESFENQLLQREQYAEQVAEFLSAVVANSSSRTRKLSNGRILFRAQRGYRMRTDDEGEVEVPDAFLPERMKPARESASEGRVNPKGQACLYLATKQDTALAEVRPWRGAYISLGVFRVIKDCKLIDFSTDKLRSVDLLLRKEQASTAEQASAIWGDIAYAFAKPLTKDDDLTEYLATQAIAEEFRKRGYDGVLYQSALGEGKCVALFDLDVAELTQCALFETKTVTHTFVQTNNWYCIPKHHPKIAAGVGLDISSPEAAQPHFLKIKYFSVSEAPPTSASET